MKFALEIDLKPFTTPSFVMANTGAGLKQDGIQELPGFPLSALDSWTLERLCDDFRDEVFRKAGKSRPPQSLKATQP